MPHERERTFVQRSQPICDIIQRSQALELATTIPALNEHLARFKTADNCIIAFVPTMGNLHEGHLTLVRRALELADIVVISIFINPMQFSLNENFDTYPRTLTEDITKLEAEGAHLLFAPTVDVIYPEGLATHTQVLVPKLTDVLCGTNRPGHFNGVTTVVCKLCNLIRPDITLFGKKDLQQLLIIRKMVANLAIPMVIEGVDIVRTHDGLALSSRNTYLSKQERATAPLLQQTLADVAAHIQNGQRDYKKLCATALKRLEEVGFTTNYLEIRRNSDLELATPEDTNIAVFASVKLGHTRLIDNIQITLTNQFSPSKG